MANAKNLGIWMDHSSAHLMEFTTDPIETKTINSSFSHLVKEQSLEKSETAMHNKEQHLQSSYYKKLGDVIRHYEAVVLFGPTDAKTELLNILRADPQFEKIRINAASADKMTQHQEHAFVRKYFSGRLI
jgi:hypothetical protein